jgi:hypothetical protein
MATPVPVPMDQLLARCLWLDGYRFFHEGDEVPGQIVVSNTCLMPWLALKAQEMAHQLLNIDFGCHFQADENTALGVFVKPLYVTANLADMMRGLFFMHALKSLFPNESDREIDLGELFAHVAAQDGRERLQMQRMPITEGTPPPIPHINIADSGVRA